MKKVLYALSVLFVSALVFTSCKKDKDDPSVVGKWGIYERNYTYTVNGQVVNQTPIEYTPNSANYRTVEFKGDGNVVFSWPNDNDSETGTYRIEGNKIFLKYTGSTTEYPAVFSVTETELTITETDEDQQGVEVNVYKYRRL